MKGAKGSGEAVKCNVLGTKSRNCGQWKQNSVQNQTKVKNCFHTDF